MRPRDRKGNASRVEVEPFRNIEYVEEALKLSVLRDPQKREPVWPCRGLVGHNLFIAIKKPKRGQSNPEAEADSPTVWIPSREIRNIGPGASRPVRALRRSNLGSSLVLFYRSSTLRSVDSAFPSIPPRPSSRRLCRRVQFLYPVASYVSLRLCPLVSLFLSVASCPFPRTPPSLFILLVRTFPSSCTG